MWESSTAALSKPHMENGAECLSENTPMECVIKAHHLCLLWFLWRSSLFIKGNLFALSCCILNQNKHFIQAVLKRRRYCGFCFLTAVFIHGVICKSTAVWMDKCIQSNFSNNSVTWLYYGEIKWRIVGESFTFYLQKQPCSVTIDWIGKTCVVYCWTHDIHCY